MTIYAAFIHREFSFSFLSISRSIIQNKRCSAADVKKFYSFIQGTTKVNVHPSAGPTYKISGSSLSDLTNESLGLVIAGYIRYHVPRRKSSVTTSVSHRAEKKVKDARTLQPLEEG